MTPLLVPVDVFHNENQLRTCSLSTARGAVPLVSEEAEHITTARTPGGAIVDEDLLTTLLICTATSLIIDLLS